MISHQTKRLFFIITLSIVFFGILDAQNFKRGFKLLEKEDFDKANEIFTEVLEEEPNSVSSHFGLALLYSNENFAQKDNLIAWEHASFTKENKGKLIEDELEVLTEYFINTEERRSSRPVKKKMDLALDIVLDKLIRQIRESNDVDFANQVLEKFPDFEYYQNTVHIRNYLEYRAVEKQNTIEGYNRFVKDFPDAAQVPLAIEKRNALVFARAKEMNTLTSLNQYILKYPESKYTSEAIKLRNKLAFDDAKKSNTVEAIEGFIHDYPDALEVLDAKIIQKQLIYERAKKIRSLDAYNDFIRKYPEGVQYVDIFNIKSEDLGQKLLARNKYPNQSFQWARVFDNDNKYDESQDIAVDDATGNIFLACNTMEDSGKMINAWIICLKNNGEMAWNKQVGEDLNDNVEQVKLLNNELYFTGLTRGVNDSIIGIPWVFKLLVDGKKIWNRTYGDKSIEAFGLTSNGEIIFGSSYATDSVQKFYLAKLNSELKRLWERKYSNKGIVSSVSSLNNGHIVAGGGNWLFKLDKDGYLLWENYLPATDSLIFTVSNEQYIGVAGIRDSLSLLLSFYDLEGKMLWEKSFVFEDGIDLTSIKLDNNNNMYFAGTSASDGVLIKIDNQGNILDNLMFGTENMVSFKSLVSTNNNEVYIIADEEINPKDKNIFLLKYLP